MKQQSFKFISKLITVFLATVLCLWLCLVLASSIPNSNIKENMKKSADILGHKQAFSFENGNKINAIGDNYADSILLNLSYNMGKDNPFISSLDTAYYDGEDNGENYGLLYTVTKDKAPNTEYTRYFHGGAMFVRLYHLFTDINGMRLISFCIICLMLAVNLVFLIHKKHYFMSFALLLSICAVQFQNIRLSLEYQSTFAVLFLTLPLFVNFEKNQNLTFCLFCISGVATAFYDFLTTETITAVIPLITILSIRAKDNRADTFKNTVKFSVRCLLVWGIAYVGTFVFKWTLASLVTGRNCFSSAIFSASERFDGNFEAYFDQAENIFSAIYTNIAIAFGATQRNSFSHAFAGSIIFLLVLFSVWYLFRSKKTQRSAACVMLILGMLAPVRFFVLNNHSFLHCFFTYRALCSTVFAFLASMYININLPFKTSAKRRQKRYI